MAGSELPELRKTELMSSSCTIACRRQARECDPDQSCLFPEVAHGQVPGYQVWMLGGVNPDCPCPVKLRRVQRVRGLPCHPTEMGLH